MALFSSRVSCGSSSALQALSRSQRRSDEGTLNPSLPRGLSSTRFPAKPPRHSSNRRRSAPVSPWDCQDSTLAVCRAQAGSIGGKPDRVPGANGNPAKKPSQAPFPQTSSTAHPQPYGVPDVGAEPEQWDVVGLGQAMVDFSAMISDEFLTSLDLPRGQRVVVDHEERGQVLQALDGCAYKLSAGGSLSNTLVALARLGKVPETTGAGKRVEGTSGPEGAEAGSGPFPEFVAPVSVKAEESGRKQVNVAMVGSVGSDALGDFYRTKLLRANVHFLSPPLQNGTTGTVIVLTTPDAQRTMLSYQGQSSEITFDSAMKAVVAKSRVLVVEGYLWELPQTVDAIAEACAVARSKGLLVALTASDASCVLRHRPKFWSVLCRSAHILFCNASEARALAGCSEATSSAALAQHLSQFCPLVSVTDGEKGSYLGLRGHVVHIPAEDVQPKDTCGAGDAYAAGVLYALLKGAPDLEALGRTGARVSGVVITQQGARLGEEDAAGVVSNLEFQEKSLAEGGVFYHMMGLHDMQPVSTAAT